MSLDIKNQNGEVSRDFEKLPRKVWLKLKQVSSWPKKTRDLGKK